nr:hypothetical protein [Tanacetum cinerariifolium]
MSAMGELTFFLGLQVKQLPDGIFISQYKYVKDMLKKFNMESVRTVTILYEVPKPKSKDEPNDAVNIRMYRSMIGSLMYLTASRPDIMFACKKQTIVATSSTEAEYVAAASCCGQSTICIVKNLIFHRKTKHIEIRHHFIWDANEKNLIQSTLGCSIPRINAVSCGFLLYAVQIISRPPMLLVVPVFLLVVLVHADRWVSTGSCTISTGSYSFTLLDGFLLATATVRTHELGPSDIIATIDGNKVVVTESLIRSQLQLNDETGLSKEVGPTAGNDSILIEDPLRPVEPWPTSLTTPFNNTTSRRLPSPTRQTSFQKDISKGGSDSVSLPKSNDAPPTTAAGGAEDSAALTDLSLKLDMCINRVTTLENELGVTKKVLGGEEAATKEKDIDLDALRKLASMSLGGDTTVKAAYTIYKASQDAHASSDAGHDEDVVPDDTTMPFRRTRTKRRRPRKTFTSSAFEHFQENISPVKDTISAGGVSAGSFMDPAGQAAAAPSSSAIPAADKGKDPMVDDSILIDLLIEQEWVLKNLHNYQLRKDLAKKLQAKQEAEFTRQQEELAQKAQVESVASPTAQGIGLSAQRRRELDVAQLIYTKADWLELMAKIATNFALSKQLLGDDVNEDNMNKRLGMLLMRKRRKLAEQSWVKPINKTQQRDFMRDFVKNQSASVYNQGWTMKQVPAALSIAADVSISAVSTTIADDSAAPTTTTSIAGGPSPSVAKDPTTPTQVPPVTPDLAAVSAHADTEVHPDDSRPDDNKTAFERVSTEHTCRESDDDPSPYAPYVGWEMVPTILGSIHAYYDMEEHTKHFTSLRKILHMVEKNDLRKLLGAVDNFYQRQEPDTFALILWGDLRVHVLETLHGRVIYMFVDVSYPLSEATLKRMLKHGLEVPKLLVGGDLTMVEQLVSFIKAALLNAQSAV